MSTWTIYFDGLCEPRNPGGRMCWAWVIDAGEHSVESASTDPPAPQNTNNVAEWMALGWGIRAALTAKANGGECTRLEIRGDSQLVIKQLTGEWGSKAEHLTRLRDRCRKLLWESGIAWDAQWIPREQNDKADALGRKAYFDAEGRMPPERVKVGAR